MAVPSRQPDHDTQPVGGALLKQPIAGPGTP
jgi:hypothetical protein